MTSSHPMQWIVEQYLIHGVRVETRTGFQEISTALRYRLGPFATALDGAPDFRVEYHAVDSAELERIAPPMGPRVRTITRSAHSQVLYDAEADVLFLSYRGQAWSVWDARRGVLRISFSQSEIANIWRLTHPMFTLPFVDALKRSGRFCVHAAGLCVDGRGLLFPGQSGQGKSTLTIALVRAGFGFLSDDLIMLAHGDDGVRMLAFPDEIDVTDETARHFPELAPALQAPVRPDWPKRQVDFEKTYGAALVSECRPAAVICPRIAHADRTRIERISADEVFPELAGNVLLTEARASQAFLDAIGELLRQVPCYRMHTGRDFDALPNLLRELTA